MKNNNLKYIRKHKHWYERTIIYSDNIYEFVRGNIEINKVNIELLNNKEMKIFNKLIILFDINSYDIVLI